MIYLIHLTEGTVIHWQCTALRDIISMDYLLLDRNKVSASMKVKEETEKYLNFEPTSVGCCFIKFFFPSLCNVNIILI